MKTKIYLTAIALMITGIITAGNYGSYGYAHSSMFITLENNLPFSITVDGRNYSNPTSSKTISRLTPGKHWIRVTSHTNGHHGYHNNHRVEYQGFVVVPARSNLVAMIDHHNQFNILSYNGSQQSHPHGNTMGHANPSGSGSGYGVYNMNYTNPWNQNNDVVLTSSNSYGYGNNYGGGCNDRMWFENLKNTIQNTSFDRSKLTVALQGISANGIYAQEVADVMDLFSFESTRLEFAKAAYELCLDQQNYFLVNKAFHFSSSINNLNNFIMGY